MTFDINILGVVSSEKATTLSSFPPYLSFKAYFWTTIVSVYLCSVIVIVNAVLRGKRQYQWQESFIPWYILFNLSGPFFVTIVTILFMGLSCDYSYHPPILVQVVISNAMHGMPHFLKVYRMFIVLQDPSIVCWSPQHTKMAILSLAVRKAV